MLSVNGAAVVCGGGSKVERVGQWYEQYRCGSVKWVGERMICFAVRYAKVCVVFAGLSCVRTLQDNHINTVFLI